jgi:GGDEF domain-containing protein
MARTGRFQLVLGVALGAVGHEVLREADVAMYAATARGKGRFELASSSA